MFQAPVSITGISSFSNYIFVPTLADMTFANSSNISTELAIYKAIAFVDIDGDMDIIAGTNTGKLLYIENTDIN